MRRRTCFLDGAVICVLNACASVPTDYERITTTALEDPAPNTAHSLFAEEVEAHPGQSGFVLLASGESAFAARDDMIAVADKTIDAQYFAWEADQTGKLFLDRMIRAADRGVRVRLLLDDIVTGGLDLGLAHLDNLPNVEVRLFNPFASRTARIFDFVGDLSRVNRRMHNKALIVDNTLAVVGGRNIGNHYFGVDTVFNYRDLDVIAVGPVVPQISDVFDVFWNSEYAVPIEVFIEETLQLEETRQLQQDLHEWAEAGADDYPYTVLREREENIQSLEAARDKLIWPNYVELLFDDPDKAGGDEDSPFVERGDLLAEHV
ncbi:MAG: phospholipase D-like domain-containing protein, partial [Nitrospirota bacterium]|nr:phospholipase D-like domain-containing protein [Nitrospirota bacterium]